MPEGLRLRLGILVARLRYRRKHEKVVSFTRAFSDAHRILLILPLPQGRETAWTAGYDWLRRSLGSRTLTIITTPEEQEAARVFPQSRIVRLGAEDFTALRLPRHAALQRALEGPYDLAIDLNIDFLLPSGYICRESDARIRVGFLRKWAESFYNFTLNPDPAQGRTAMYNRLAGYLQMF